LDVEVVDLAAHPGSDADGRQTALAARYAEVLVVDGYHLGRDFRRGLGRTRALRVGIDDNLENDPRDLDVVVNQAPGVDPCLYTDRARVALVGPKHALLRSDITELLPVDRPFGPASDVLVAMGGTDVMEAAGPIARSIAAISDLTVFLATGIANPRAAELRRLAAGSGGRIRAILPDDLPATIARADLGVVAAGGTLWECAALGLPVVTLITADNQQRLTETAEVRSFASVHDLRVPARLDAVAADALRLANDPAVRHERSRAGVALVDGCGAERVVGAVLTEVRASDVRLEGRRS
jgi:spore coat polysaccharide biosynthesis predicted glycosyltransferase SpsG